MLVRLDRISSDCPKRELAGHGGTQDHLCPSSGLTANSTHWGRRREDAAVQHPADPLAQAWYLQDWQFGTSWLGLSMGNILSRQSQGYTRRSYYER